MHRPEVVYHLAGAANVGESWRDPVSTFRGERRPHAEPARGGPHPRRAARAARVERRRVRHRGRGRAAPRRGLPRSGPTSPYAASKVAADYLALQAWLGHGLETIRVRAFNHLGPGQAPGFVAPALATAIARNELDGDDEIPIGNLTPRRDFTDVRDVVRAYRLLMEQGEAGEVYNVCSGRDIAIQELADLLVGMATTPMRLVTDPDRYRPVDIPVLRGSNAKIQAATGWSPVVLDRDTLGDLLDECRARARSDVATHGNPKSTPRSST